MKKAVTGDTKNKLRPALSPDSRENQMIALAMDAAEERLRNGTASSQLICHYLKLGSSLTRLEKERIELENNLTKAKTKAVNSSESSEKLYADAIKAFQIYSGNVVKDEPDN